MHPEVSAPNHRVSPVRRVAQALRTLSVSNGSEGRATGRAAAIIESETAIDQAGSGPASAAGPLPLLGH